MDDQGKLLSCRWANEDVASAHVHAFRKASELSVKNVGERRALPSGIPGAGSIVRDKGLRGRNFVRAI